LRGQLPRTLLAQGDDGLRALRSYPVQRPPLADLRAAA
jgi:hypothetical protein